ncbi:hypothetical protein LINPERHAP1_LOCUS8418, partial [Linum perenne]
RESYHFHDEINQWYHGITRRTVSHRGAVDQSLLDGMERLYVTTGQSHITPQEQQEMHATLRSMMHASGGIHRTAESRRAPRQATHPRHAAYPVPDPPAARIPSTRRVRQHVDV